jgi:PAS domain S-box-containing protein
VTVFNTPTTRRRVWLGYGLAVVLTVLAAAVKLRLDAFIGSESPFLLMIAPPIVAAWYAGLGPALLATFLSALSTALLFFTEPGSLRLTPDETTQLAIFAAEAVLLAVWTVARDRARQAVRAADQKAASILESISDAFIALDSGFRYTFANEAAETLMGKKGENLLGREIWQVYPSLAGSTLEADLRRAMAERVQTAGEYAAPIDSRWLEVRAYPATDGGLSIYFRDVTERRRVEEQSRHLAAIVESSDDAIFSTSLEGTILTWNLGAERIYGYTAAEAIGKPFSLLLPPEAAREVSGRLERLREGFEARYVEAEHVRRDGTRVPAAMTISPIRDAAGRVTAASVVARDIAERKRLEQSMREGQKLESLGVLAGGVAHDFNNLLTGIMGYAGMAQEMLPRGHPACKALENVIHAGERAAELTRQMLAYSGKGSFVLEPVDLGSLVREITALIQSSISRKVQLELKLAEKLPPVVADAGQMQQLIMNLVINAAEAIGEDAGVVTVAAGAGCFDDETLRTGYSTPYTLEPGEYVWLEVKDTGCGMEQETLSRIFDPFFTTKFTGRGLGLAAVSGIVRGHRGALSVTSAPGRGSTFRVILPAASRPADAAAPPPPSPSVVSAETRTVLVVDDEEMVRHTAAAALRQHGFEVIEADGGASAIRLFASRAAGIGLVLLDMTMPDMSGDEVLRHLRAIRPDVKVVVSSGYSEKEAFRRFSGQAITAFIQKPYTAATLAEKLKRAA